MRIGRVGKGHTPRGHGDRPALRHGITRIDGKVDEHLVELMRVANDMGDIVAGNTAQLNRFWHETPEQGHTFDDERIEVERAGLNDLLAREGQKLVRERRAAPADRFV